ncbi:MAG: hypothetical protein KDB80_10660 [Planctomycetes bacterium]|nr:hypothetical protein [Planctomycetota bacterium]
MRSLALAALSALVFPVLLPAQQWRWEEVESVGVKFLAVGRLERLPMKLGESSLYHRARLRPKDIGDHVNGQYVWYCDIYEFQPAKEGEDEGPDFSKSGLTEEQQEMLRKMLANSSAKRLATFEDWIDSQEDAKVTQRGRQRKGSLPFKHWKWIRNGQWYQPQGKMYGEAAVYSFEDREVALVIEVPITKRSGTKPSSKWAGYIKRMITSGRVLEVDEDEDDSSASRDKFADTPAKQAALDAAKANIAELKGWDYFTTPNYIVLYAWDFEDPGDRVKARNDAKYYSSRLEKMRELYEEEYELDETGVFPVLPDPATLPGGGPTTGAEKEADPREFAKKRKADLLAKTSSGDEGGGEIEMPYPVFRLCATYDQFMKYGGSPRGVVGWFSPMSKELVVFLGGDKMMGKGATETVTYHEGWHQYADLYFNGPTTKGGTLHRWFDEGHGDFFGSYRLAGSKWVYEGSKMRADDVRQMVRKKDYQPFDQIVTWHTRRFYGPNAPYYYAQAYAMIDFFRRGSQLERNWDPRYGKILERYRTSMLLYGDDDQAVKHAFFGFTDEDWRKLEADWEAWVESRYYKTG